jgi:CheY-like chemotaxis protein
MKKYTIIIVENDEDEQFFMKEGFDGEGLFEILAQVDSGDELSEWLDQHPDTMPDVILSDLNMPGKNGYDVIADMKSNEAYAHIPVIITSTSSTRLTIDRCMALGAAHYMVKPETFTAYGPFVRQLYQLLTEKQLVK